GARPRSRRTWPAGEERHRLEGAVPKAPDDHDRVGLRRGRYAGLVDGGTPAPEKTATRGGRWAPAAVPRGWGAWRLFETTGTRTVEQPEGSAGRSGGRSTGFVRRGIDPWIQQPLPAGGRPNPEGDCFPRVD